MADVEIVQKLKADFEIKITDKEAGDAHTVEDMSIWYGRNYVNGRISAPQRTRERASLLSNLGEPPSVTFSCFRCRLLPSEQVKEMTDASQTFLNESRRYLRDEYPESIDRPSLHSPTSRFAGQTGLQQHRQLDSSSCRNVRQWIVAGVGQQPNGATPTRIRRARKTRSTNSLPALRPCSPNDVVLANLQEGGFNEARRIGAPTQR